MLLGFTQACSSCLLIDELITKHAAALNLDEAEQHDDAVAAYADEGQAPAGTACAMLCTYCHPSEFPCLDAWSPIHDPLARACAGAHKEPSPELHEIPTQQQQKS